MAGDDYYLTVFRFHIFLWVIKFKKYIVPLHCTACLSMGSSTTTNSLSVKCLCSIILSVRHFFKFLVLLQILLIFFSLLLFTHYDVIFFSVMSWVFSFQVWSVVNAT